jgi:hypothetical protein
MNRAVLAGALALAMMGPLSVSQHGFGPAPAVAQEGSAPAVAQEGPAVVVTEGKIARLRAALRLTAEQMAHWRPVEAALRAAIREQRQTDGWVHKVRDRVSGYAGSAMALQQAYAAAGPLISSLDEQQRQSGRNALRQMGGASLF